MLQNLIDLIKQRRCLVRALGMKNILDALLVLCAASSSSAGAAHDGAELFQKHCLACHQRPLAASTFESLLQETRTPPPGMPAFHEERLSDQDVLAIAEHLFSTPHGEENRPAQKGQPSGASEGASKTGPSAVEAAAGSASVEAAGEGRRTLKERKAWLRGFGTH